MVLACQTSVLSLGAPSKASFAGAPISSHLVANRNVPRQIGKYGGLKPPEKMDLARAR